MTDAETDSGSPRDVLAAYERFRLADAARHARLRVKTGMGDNEIRLVQFLMDSEREGHQVMPSEIARHLRISSASTTALLDRLERSGTIERVTHPTDRRSLLIAPTAAASAALDGAVRDYDSQMLDVSAALDEPARRILIRFFGDLERAADSESAPAGSPREG